MRICLLGRLVWIFLALVCTAQAQPHLMAFEDLQDEVVDMNRPRLAVAPDGTVAIAVEALVVDDGGRGAWQVAVQLFRPSGEPVAEPVFFAAEDGSVILWDSDYVEHVEIAFLPDGTLLLLMEHWGFVADTRSSEIAVGAVGSDGRIIDLHANQRKVQEALSLPSSTSRAFEERRPRLAVMPDGGVLITLEGSSSSSHLNYVAVKVFDAGLNEVNEQYIPHDDPGSEQSFHIYSDIATNGALGLVVWQECPVVDNQGNADDCDVVAQFFADQTIGGNVQVNAGDAFGTLNLWPSAAMSASGESVVVWADTRTGPQGDILCQRFNAAGQPAGANLLVSDGTGEIQDRPEVAMLNDGRFMVVWTDSSAVGFRARGRRFDAAGNPLEAPFTFREQPGLQTGFADVASNGSDFVYSWGGDQGGGVAIYTNTLGIVVANEEEETSPSAFALAQNYPNPFNPTTTIAYDLPKAAPVRLVVYNLMGREVETLVQARQAAGRHEVPFDASHLAGGVYVYRIEAGAWHATRHFVLLK